MSRSSWKIPFQDKHLLKLIDIKSKATASKKLKIFARASTISKFFVNKIVYVHIGNQYKRVRVTKKHLGFKFGEFAPTRKVGTLPEKTKKKKKK